MSSHYASLKGQHAVVCGAGIARLLAARVLADHFEHVTLIERDQLPKDVCPRKGVPQGRHIHYLLDKGATILEDLFPGLLPTLIQDGSVPVGTKENRGHQFPNKLITYSQSRPFLECHIRDYLAARVNVRFIDRCKIAQLCANDAATSITGVSLQFDHGEHCREKLSADIVVDASGRGSQAPQWLSSLGYPKVEETRVKIDVGYATRIYHRPNQGSSDWEALSVPSTLPQSRRRGVILPIEDDSWMVTLIGQFRDYPPDYESGFLDYASSLLPELYEAIKNAEPITPIVIHKFPANQRRHYERLPRFPNGFVVFGDALCSLNPVYGQGMTVAAMEASALQACLTRRHRLGSSSQSRGSTRGFQKAVAKVVNAPWLMVTNRDFGYQEKQQHQRLVTGLLQWYKHRLQELAAADPQVALLLSEVTHLARPPTALLDPRIVFAALWKGWHLLGSHAADRELSDGSSV